jgi:two-component system sensor histidine kinase ResE
MIKKLFFILVVIGILPMLIFTFLTISGYQNIIDKQNDYIVENQKLIKETELNYQNIKIQTVLIFVLLSIFILFFSIVITRKFLYPIKSLMRGTEELKKGKFNYRIKLNTKDEFQSLAESFNEMAKQLNLKINELSRERKKSEEEKNKTAAIINNFIDPILVIDRKGKFSLFNPSAKIIFGFTKKSLGSIVDSGNYYSMDNFKKISKRVFLVTALGRVDDNNKNEEEVVIDFEGQEMTYRVTTVSIYDNENNYLGIMKLFHNLTREKEVDKLKSEFITIAAHQLRTPLSAVKWSIKMVTNGDLGEVNEEQKELLERGYESNERMIRLVNDLLDVSRIEEGKFGYKFENVDFNLVVDEVLENIYSFVEKNSLKLVVNKPSGATNIYIDREKMTLAIGNIVDNAIKYTPEFGKILIDVSIKNKALNILIKDAGVGIPGQDMPKLFTKFFRATNVVRMQTEGSGLGLFISKNIIEKHGGSMEVKSDEGKGTEVFCILPLKNF